MWIGCVVLLQLSRRKIRQKTINLLITGALVAPERAYLVAVDAADHDDMWGVKIR